MDDRGEFRELYVSFCDDPGVHALSHEAFRVLMTLKLALPPIGIGVVYDEQLGRRCKMSPDVLARAYAELEQPKGAGRLGWIVREENVVWLVKALGFARNLNPKNPTNAR